MTDDELKALIESRWSCQVHDYAAGFHPMDSYVTRDGQVIAYAERKTRTVPRTRYATAQVDERKWVGMIAAEYATGLPAFLFYAWSCGSWGWIRPTADVPVTVRVSTPDPASRSLNAGVPRPVVEFPITLFTLADTFGEA